MPEVNVVITIFEKLTVFLKIQVHEPILTLTIFSKRDIFCHGEYIFKIVTLVQGLYLTSGWGAAVAHQ
jgi:hypothetical protein